MSSLFRFSFAKTSDSQDSRKREGAIFIPLVHFEELLRKDNTVYIHHRNLQLLATEIFKIKNNLAPEILSEIFQNRTSS